MEQTASQVDNYSNWILDTWGILYLSFYFRVCLKFSQEKVLKRITKGQLCMYYYFQEILLNRTRKTQEGENSMSLFMYRSDRETETELVVCLCLELSRRILGKHAAEGPPNMPTEQTSPPCPPAPGCLAPVFPTNMS